MGLIDLIAGCLMRMIRPLVASQARAVLLLLVLFLGAYASPAPSWAQSAITVVDLSAQPDFPNRITFTLVAESSAAPITTVQLLYGATRQGTLTIVEPGFAASQRVQVQHELDTQVFYFPPGTDLSYRWVITDQAGNQLETPLQTLIYHDQRFTWQERSERGVTVYWYRGGDSFGAELLQIATRTLDKLQQEIGTSISDPVKIYAYANQRDMLGALQANEVEWVGGQAWPDLGLIVGVIGPGDSDEARRLIPHELSHQVLHQATANPYGGLPVWFDEGLAVYNEEVSNSGFADLVDDAARSGRLIPLAALAASFPADPELALQSYAQSQSVVAFIISTYGEAKLQELVAAFRSATPVETALQRVLGISVDELDAAWRATLPVPQTVPTPPAAVVAAPADRFRGNPVLPPGVAPATPNTPTLLPGLNLPLWLGATLVLLCCLTLGALSGVGVLLTLRLTRGNRRAN